MLLCQQPSNALVRLCNDPKYMSDYLIVVVLFLVQYLNVASKVAFCDGFILVNELNMHRPELSYARTLLLPSHFNSLTLHKCTDKIKSCSLKCAHVCFMQCICVCAPPPPLT